MQVRKKVLARLKKPGGPLKTIRLMKYVKAHKETQGPFRKAGSGGCVGRGKAQEARQNPPHQQKMKTMEEPVDTH